MTDIIPPLTACYIYNPPHNSCLITKIKVIGDYRVEVDLPQRLNCDIVEPYEHLPMLIGHIIKKYKVDFKQRLIH